MPLGIDTGGIHEPEGADHRLRRRVVYLVGDASPLEIARLQGLTGQPIQASLIALEFASLSLRIPVQLVELLARGHHLGQRRGRGAATVGAAGSLLDLPLEQLHRVAQDAGRGPCGSGVRRRRLPGRPAERARGDSGGSGYGGRVPLSGRRNSQNGGRSA